MFEKYLSPVFIETGTSYGGGVREAINVGFKKIISIESKPEYYDYCCKDFEPYIKSGIVKLVLGRSEICLLEILLGIDCRATFWLDAHPTGSDNFETSSFPLRREIEIICRHKIKDHIILIDDVRIFNSLGVTKEWIIKKVMHKNRQYEIAYDSMREGKEFKNDVMVIKVKENN